MCASFCGCYCFYFRGAYKYDEVLGLADESAINSVKKNQHFIKTDDGCNIQFTSVNETKNPAQMNLFFKITFAGNDGTAEGRPFEPL